MAIMTTSQTTSGQAGGTVPVACTLTSAGLAAQAGRWERLMARAMTECTQTSDGLRMSFRPEPGVEEELRRLVAVETKCCPWATWTVETNAGATVLDVRSADPGIAALHGMFPPVQAAR
jgi:hypothetical protein